MSWRRILWVPVRGVFAAIELLDRLDLPFLSRIPAKRKRRLGQRIFGRLAALAPREIRRSGLTLHVPRGSTSSYLLREHEPETLRFLTTVLRPGMVCVDVGANIGLLALFMARAVSPGGRVIAVEAEPRNLAVLEDNVRRNGLGEVVRIVPVAAAGEHARRRLYKRSAGTLHSLYAADRDDPGRSVEVAGVPLDDLVEGRADLIKIDVEGAEIEVLQGMSRLLSAEPPRWLVVEWNPSALTRAGQPPEALPERLTAAGYSLAILDAAGRRPTEVDTALADLEGGRLGPTWHGNLIGELERSP